MLEFFSHSSSDMGPASGDQPVPSSAARTPSPSPLAPGSSSAKSAPMSRQPSTFDDSPLPTDDGAALAPGPRPAGDCGGPEVRDDATTFEEESQTEASASRSMSPPPAGAHTQENSPVLLSTTTKGAAASASATSLPVPAAEFTLPTRAIAGLLLRWFSDDRRLVPQPSGCVFQDIFTLRAQPPMPLYQFVERIEQYTACDAVCYTVALALVRRALFDPVEHNHSDWSPTRNPAHVQTASSTEPCDVALTISRFNAHRLFATATLMAIKSTQDVYHPMQFYGAVFGVDAPDLRRMEGAFMKLLDSRLYVSRADAQAVMDEALRVY